MKMNMNQWTQETLDAKIKKARAEEVADEDDAVADAES